MVHNPGTTFDPDLVREARLDDGRAAARAVRCAEPEPETTSAGSEVEALRTAVGCLDLTHLGAETTVARIEALCARARSPLPTDAPGGGPDGARVAAVCVFPESVAAAVAALGDTSIPVAAACGFPDAGDPLERRIGEIRASAAAGAREVDVVVDRRLILGDDWPALYNQVRSLRDASPGLLLKVILRSGTLPSAAHVFRAGLTSAMAGADFLKTSTGMDSVNATPAAGIALCDAVRTYNERTGFQVGLKPAGGLRTVSDALEWMRLTRGELGTEWIDPSLFRLGASSLLDALSARLDVLGAQ